MPVRQCIGAVELAITTIIFAVARVETLRSFMHPPLKRGPAKLRARVGTVRSHTHSRSLVSVQRVPVAKFIARGGLEVLAIDEVDAFGVDAFVTTREGGVSEAPYDSLNLGLHVGDVDDSVIKNREVVASALGVDLDAMVFCNQTHGTRSAVVDSTHAGRGARFSEHALIGTDALITTTPGVPLVIMVADCCPILFVDPVAHVLGVAHAGWRGTADKVATETILAMRDVGAQVKNIKVVIGPSINQDRYEVGTEVVEAVVRSVSGDLGDALLMRDESAYIDIALVNAQQLLELGVESENLSILPWRTDDPRFYSDREARPTGRFALVAQILP